jgi:hypothetical protein
MTQDGVAFLELLLTQATWIRRHITEISFDDATVIRRTSTFDVSFESSPDSLRQHLPRRGGRVPLPVDSVKRSVSYNITVRTAGGEPIPPLTRSEERSLVADLLVELSHGNTPDAALSDDRRREILLWSVDPSMHPNPMVLTSEQRWLDSLEAAVDYFRRFRLVIANPL